MNRLIIGLPKPENAFDPQTPDDMRRAILRWRRESSLIANVLIGAQYNGLSGEDTYVTLAYHALRMLEDKWQRELRMAELSLHPPTIIKR